MSFKIGLVGKPSVGKSTFYNAATMNNIEEGDYPFTTIEPSEGEAYVRVDCAGPDFNVSCDPRTGDCVEGTRFVPVNLIDIAGLIPGAHKGKGLGNQFLTDLNEADVLIHVVDFSGKTDEEGEPIEQHDPRLDIDFLEEELDQWYFEILEKGISRFNKKNRSKEVRIEETLEEQMSAFNIKRNKIKFFLDKKDLSKNPDNWDKVEKLELARAIRKETKPMIIAANKMDTEQAKENYNQIIDDEDYSHLSFVPCSARVEKSLKKADERGVIDYSAGDSDFVLKDEDVEEDVKNGLERMRDFIKRFDGSGVQKALETALFDELGVLAVFPGGKDGLEDEHGNILPDCFLLSEGSTVEDFAYSIHSDIGDNLLYGFDVREDRKVSASDVLEHRDVIKIVTS